MRSFLLCFYLLTVILKGYSQEVNFTSSNLPIVVIETHGQSIPDDPKITADMGIIFNGDGVRNQLSDPFNHYQGKIGIEIRGQSSQMFPMKSYSIELRKENGSSLDKSLFGMPEESDWVMYAPYTDKTLMRNFLAYTMSRELGQWAANCRFVEVVLNGRYNGIYVFMERIKRNKGRVNIPKMSASDATGDAVTGGYIFSLDKEPNGWFSSFTPPNSQTGSKPQFSYVYPKPEDISDAQKAYIKSYVDSFEQALAGPAFQDPARGVRHFADLPSFMDYFMVNEVSRNVDGYRLSAFFHKNRNSVNRKIFAGPVWDYDLAFRNADYCNGSNVNGWAWQFNNVCPADGAGLVPFWWERLMKDTAFTSALLCRWKTVRQTSLSEQRLLFLIDSISSLVQEAQVRHFTRWPVLGQYIWPNPQPIPTSYGGEISMLKSWLKTRLKWIDENLVQSGACSNGGNVAAGSFSIKVLSNPLSPDSRLILNSSKTQVIYMEIVDMSGRKIMVRKLNALAGTVNIPLDASSWPAGMYVVRTWNEAGEERILKLMEVQ